MIAIPFTTILLALVSSTSAEEDWLWQFADDEEQDSPELQRAVSRGAKVIARMLSETGGEGEGEADGDAPTPAAEQPTPTPGPSIPALCASTPSPTTLSVGECIGNDSRCKGSNQNKCDKLDREGTDCVWESVWTSGGTCLGNDSRCGPGGHATCLRLSKEGADCRWDGADICSASPGVCVGNDSRCADSSGTECSFLESEGADCKWRATFSVIGSLVMATAESQSFLSNPDAKGAIREGLANLTSVPPEYIDVDLIAETRRLQGRSLSQSSNVLATYAIIVTGDDPESIQVTGDEVGEKLKASNLGAVQSAVSASIEKVLGGGFSDMSIASVAAPDVLARSIPTPAPQEPVTTAPTAAPPAPTPTPASPASAPAPLPVPAPAPSPPAPAPAPSLPAPALAPAPLASVEPALAPAPAPAPVPSSAAPAPAQSPPDSTPAPAPPAPTPAIPQESDFTASAMRMCGLCAPYLLAIVLVLR